MAYTLYGPFSNGSAPGISAQFLNNVETFLVTINSVATDPNLSSDGHGNLSVVKVILTSGSLSRKVIVGGSGTATVTHNWGVTPDGVQVTYAGNFGTPPTQAIASYGIDNNNIKVVAQSGYSWLATLEKA